MLILKNGLLYTMSKPPFIGDIALEGGKIIAVGGNIPENGAQVIDVGGRHLTPGLIDAHSHIGLLETGTRDSDHNEATNPITPQMRVMDAINPMDSAFESARAAGVTSCVVCPGSINLIGGTCTAIKTAGTVVDDMVLKNPAAMKMALGENPKQTNFSGAGKPRYPRSRMGVEESIRLGLYRRLLAGPNVSLLAELGKVARVKPTNAPLAYISQ